MKYLRVKNWEKLQHQSDKALPWIKFYTALLAPTKETIYSEWPDATKALLHHLWLMASVFSNRIPETWLTKEKLNLKSRINLDPILVAGFAWFETEDGLRLSHSRARDARSVLSESKSLAFDKNEEKPFNVTAEFEALWQKYPSRKGRKAAYKHFCASVSTLEELEVIKDALENYVQSDRVKRGFVQDGATWFNNWKDWIPDGDSAHERRSVTAEDVREVEADLRLGWIRSDIDRDTAEAWLHEIRERYVRDGLLLPDAPTLQEFARQRAEVPA